MLASLVNVSHLVEVSGYPLLFVLVMAESSGVPIPGETALITAAVLASGGKLKIEVVIPLAALAAIVGDNIGYLIGRKGGRWLLERPGRFQAQRRDVLETGEPFFERHGPKAVFFGRFILGLRVWASWLAGATHMRWRSFFLWNALGGICWATAIGLLAYLLGHSAGKAIEAFGIYGLVAVLIAILSTFFLHRRHRRRHPHAEPRHHPGPETPPSATAATPDSAPGDPETPLIPDAATPSGPETPGRKAYSAAVATDVAVTARRDTVPEVGQRAQLALGETREEVLSHDRQMRAARFFQALPAELGQTCVGPTRVVVARAALQQFVALQPIDQPC
jgi:membrane protein DedA with SNARE-associated domain